jgi:hypothetical protein
MALHAWNLLIARQLVLDAQRFAKAVELIVIPPIVRWWFPPTTFRAPES